MRNEVIGALIVAAVLAAAWTYGRLHRREAVRSGNGRANAPAGLSPAAEPEAGVIHLSGEAGGEKLGFLEDSEVKSLLHAKYGMALTVREAGSIEMVDGGIRGGLDFLWPSSGTALQLFQERHERLAQKSEIIFNSPFVLYSWDIIVDALIKTGILKKEENIYYIYDLRKLVDLVFEEKTWQEIGIPELYGKISIVTTDPAISGSANAFAALLAIALQGSLPDETTIEAHLPRIREFFTKQGYMERSSGELFSQFLRMGVGAYPIIAGYENQILELAATRPEVWQRVQGRIRILYPLPTLWTSHPIIVINRNALRLAQALRDPELLRIAWERHGFRTELGDAPKISEKLKEIGVLPQIRKTVPLPSWAVMRKILETLQPQEKRKEAMP